jgi:alpha-1,2-mannosyltransferase
MAHLIDLIDRYGGWILAAWIIFTGYTAFDVWQGDMAGIFMAAHFYAAGQFDLIYASNSGVVSEAPAVWLPALTEMGKANVSTFPYVYPPLWASLLSPLTQVLSVQGLLNGALIVQLALYGWAIWLAWDLTGRIMPWGRWAVLAVPLSTLMGAPFIALLLNQPQITISFLILLATRQLVLGRDMRAGLILALAAGIKLTPLVFLLLFPVLRRWRGLAAMVAGLVVIAVLGVMMAGPDMTRAFVERAAALSNQTMASRITYNIAPLLIPLMPGEVEVVKSFGDASFVATTPPLLKVVTLAILLALLALSVHLTRALDPARRAFVLATAFTLITALAGPIGWVHYYLGPTLLLPGLLAPTYPRWVKFYLVVAAMCLSATFMLSAPMDLAIGLPALTYLVFTAILVGDRWIRKPPA